jgi:hypothetical protein
MHVWLEWATKITLNAVQDGGLAISIDLDRNIYKVSADPLVHKIEGASEPSQRSVMDKESALQNALISSLTNSRFREIETQLQKDLNNSARFVVPGQGTFKYKNPMFNDNGDLFIEVSYKE